MAKSVSCAGLLIVIDDSVEILITHYGLTRVIDLKIKKAFL